MYPCFLEKLYRYTKEDVTKNRWRGNAGKEKERESAESLHAPA